MTFLDKACEVSQFVSVDIFVTSMAKPLRGSDQFSEEMRRKHNTMFSSFFGPFKKMS